jgi:subtilisin
VKTFGRLGMRTFLRSVVGGVCLAIFLAGSAATPVAGASGVGTIPGQYIVVLKPGADRAAAVAQARALGGDVFMQYRYALNGYAVRLPEAALGAIQRDARVLFVSEDGEMGAAAAGECTDLTRCQRLSIGVDRIDGEQSSTRSGDGRGSVNVNVAVLDTGIDTLHPDLNVVGGRDCTSGAGIDDPNGHGTGVAGLIGARDNAFGRVGVAPGARLWSVRVLPKDGEGTLSQVICGVDWVTSTRADSDPTNDIAVANMSLGGPLATPGPDRDDGNCGRTDKDPLHLAICGSVAAGVTYVVSAMNDSIDFANTIPATYDEVLTATAIADYDGQPGGLASPTCAPLGADDSAASFSNFATLPSDQAHTVAAPGVCLGTTFPTSTYTIFFGGTSFASPLVAGMVALCIVSGPCAGLTPAQIVQKIGAGAAGYNTKKLSYGFVGDPLRPISGKYYGYLIRAGLY